MKNRIAFWHALICAGILACSSPALADFSGYYALNNWTFSNTNADGWMITDYAPGTLVLVGGSNSAVPKFPGDTSGFGATRLTISAPVSGPVSFSWRVESQSTFPTLDDLFFGINGVGTLLDRDLPYPQSGVFSKDVVAGDTFGFGLWTYGYGAARLVGVISDFSAPVPVPATLALVGIGLAGLGAAKRRKAH